MTMSTMTVRAVLFGAFLSASTGLVAQVEAATRRLKDAGPAAFAENDTSCCYAPQDKVWVTGPGGEPWEVYVVKADADTLGRSAAADRGRAAACACGPATEEPGETKARAEAEAGAGCC